ncbi:MAG: hypothetical protein IKR19_09035 [Acholeplasmatales bacterium]|nr:hypothetical protein [Acholeplasmatales bacterium]
MFYTPNGIGFTDLNDLMINYLSEMGLSVDQGQYLVDQETGNILKYKEKNIKVSINGIPAYAGLTDIVFDPFHNYGIVSNLFGLFIDRSQDTDDGDILQGYIAHGVEDGKGENADKQRVAVKTMGRGEIASNYYRSVFLAFADCTFRISGYNVDLSAFDIIEEKK